MKKLKNKLFYLYSFILYVFLIFIFFHLSNFYIKPVADAFIRARVTSNIYSDTNIIEIVIDDVTAQKYDVGDTYVLTTDLLGYFSKYATPKAVGADIIFTDFKDDMVSVPKYGAFVKQVSVMDNLVSAISPEEDVIGDDKSFIEDFKKKHALDVNIKTNKPLKTQFAGIESSSAILRNKTKHFGTVRVVSSSNYIFDYTNIFKVKDGFYPSLPLKLYLLSHNTNKVNITDKYIEVPATGLKIPYKYKNGQFLTPIRYYKLMRMGKYEPSYTHLVLPAYKILDTYKALESGITPKTHPEKYQMKSNDSLINPEIFKDKIIVIGGNLSGPSADVLRTPIEDRHPGLDIIATTWDNLENDTQIITSPWYVSFILFLLLCIPTFILILKKQFVKGLLLVLLLDFIYLFGIFFVGLFGFVTNYSAPLVLQFVTTVFAYTFKFLNENRNKEQIKTAMGKYLSKDVMQNVVKNIDNLGLGGKRAVVTVLFSDIRGFTSMSEKMAADEVSMILNEYFSEMEPIIRKYNGIINKFIGDAVMAIFGEPIQDINHPKNAVKCAYEMLKKVEYLREKWMFEGKPKFEIGIGINTGEVFIGNIGTENRMEYTVIGDTVNLASRIEGYNKVYKTNLLVSSTTYNYIADCADVIKIKEVQIRGKAKKMDIYEVLRIDTDKN